MNNRLVCIVLAVVLAVLPSLGCAIEMGEDITGVGCYPEGTDEQTASYVYRFAYPTVDGDSDLAAAINTVYRYEADYIVTFTVPVNGEMYGQGDTQFYTDMSYRITCNTDAWLSVLFTTREYTGAEEYAKVNAHVFTLTGTHAGTIVNLPVMLGLLKAGENDEWLEERQTAKCNACVRSLIWEKLMDQAADGSVELYDDVDEEYFAGVFYPEEDFYLDEDGSLVFFLQEDTVAPVSFGVLTYRFTMDELLDEL